MKVIFLIITLSCFLLSSDNQKLNTISISGNKITKNEIIIRELEHPLYNTFSDSISHKDKERLYNLGIFSNVEILQRDSIYQINIIESPKYIGAPIFDYDEGEGLNYGGLIRINNFRGLNQKITLEKIGGNKNTTHIRFYDSYFFGKQRSLKINYINTEKTNPVYQYNYDFILYDFGSNYFYNRYKKIFYYFGYKSLNLNCKNEVCSNILINNNFQFYYARFDYLIDSRDILIDPISGYYFNLNLAINRDFKNNQFNYYPFFIKFQKFFKINSKELVFSIKSKILYQFGTLPMISKKYIGGEDYVRGYSPIPNLNHKKYSALIEGYHIIYQSFELQNTFLQRKNYLIDNNTGIEFGIDYIIFIDTGLTYNNINKLNIHDGLFGYGLGLKFFISNFPPIELSLGFNPQGQYFLHFND